MISDALQRLTKHSAIYALGPLAQKAIGFLLLPFVTAYIGTTSNYGVVEMSAVTLAFAGQLLGINLLYGMTRFYPECATEAEKGRLVTTCLLMLVCTTGLAFFAALALRAGAAALLFGSSAHADALVVVAAILFLQTVGQVGLRWLQVLERSVAYGVLTTLKTVLEVGLKVWLMAGLGLALMGALYSVLGGEAVVAAGMTIWIVRRLGLSFSWPVAKRLIRYSYPLVISGVPMFALHQADRVFVEHYAGLAGVGLYSLAYKLGTTANVLLLDAFGLIWFPFIFGVKDEEARRAICRAVLLYFNALMCCVSLAIAVFSPEIVRLMADEKFFESHRAMPLVLAGYACWAIYQIVHTAFYIRERTGWVTLLVGCAAAANLALNWILVPSMGYMGAAWATLLTFAGLAIAAWILAERTLRVGYEIARVLGPLALAGGLYAVSRQLTDDSVLVGSGVGGNGVASLALRAVLVLALPAGLWVGGFFRSAEKSELRFVIRTGLRDLAAFLRRRPASP